MAKGQRDSKREAFWRGVLAKFRDSGLNIRDFCRQAKITEASFYAWRRAIKQRDAEQARPPARRDRAVRQPQPCERHQTQPAFMPVVVRDDAATDANTYITVELGHGSRRRLLRLPAMIATDRLAELVRAVESVAVAPESQP